MKAGRVIDGDEHDAAVAAKRTLADAASAAARVVAEARAEADRIRAAALADAASARDARSNSEPSPSPHGRVDEVIGLVVRATVSGVSLGELVHIDRRGARPLIAEVVGFRGEQALLLPYGELAGIAAASAVWRTGEPLSIRCGTELLGRVVNGIGDPIDGGAELSLDDTERWLVDRPAPPALERPPITTPQPTGVRVIDALLTLGRGQRVGLFAAAGVGKSTLLGQIARGTDADVNVLCLVGERGRELSELLHGELAGARHKTIVVRSLLRAIAWRGETLPPRGMHLIQRMRNR